MVFIRMTTWPGCLRALDKLNARFQRMSTLRGYNQLCPHERRCGPLWELTDEIGLMAHSL
jgi:hypothetical protein